MRPDTSVPIDVAGVVLDADIVVPEHARGAVLFAHGSGSSRHSPRNRMVAGRLADAGFATVLVDLLTGREEEIDRVSAGLRFDIALLAGRLVGIVDWLGRQAPTGALPVGLFGASTGSAAALVAAAQRADTVGAVVSRSGRPDLAGDALSRVRAPTLLVVGGDDPVVVDLNERAARLIAAPCEVRIVPHASHLFSEPGTLEQVADRATDWFDRHLSPRS
ncbi:dienelactone hydrolase family protein [Luedemannella helvata]|uniref:Dienelactone hydrolase domain-containing protein n=1 Tax=Luedemannella helvata TaxID=349315 RepID=A0ABN2KWS4_9ACTN